MIMRYSNCRHLPVNVSLFLGVLSYTAATIIIKQSVLPRLELKSSARNVASENVASIASARAF